VAVAAAVMACTFAWRELSLARRGHAKAMLATLQEHGRQLTEERTRNAAVVDTLSQRIADARTVIEKLRVMVAELKMQVSGLRGDTVYLAGEVSHRENVIAALRETVRAREAELISLREEDDCEVHHMPRRVLAEHESAWDEIPGVDELWTDGSHPTVVDLKMIETAMVLPNYEVDRKLA
jgi:chromosome segregation ATPase